MVVILQPFEYQCLLRFYAHSYAFFLSKISNLYYNYIVTFIF